MALCVFFFFFFPFSPLIQSQCLLSPMSSPVCSRESLVHMTPSPFSKSCYLVTFFHSLLMTLSAIRVWLLRMSKLSCSIIAVGDIHRAGAFLQESTNYTLATEAPCRSRLCNTQGSGLLALPIHQCRS